MGASPYDGFAKDQCAFPRRAWDSGLGYRLRRPRRVSSKKTTLTAHPLRGVSGVATTTGGCRNDDSFLEFNFMQFRIFQIVRGMCTFAQATWT